MNGNKGTDERKYGANDNRGYKPYEANASQRVHASSTRIHIHTRTRACTHARTHARKHARTYARTRARTRTHARTLARTHARTHRAAPWCGRRARSRRCDSAATRTFRGKPSSECAGALTLSAAGKPARRHRPRRTRRTGAQERRGRRESPPPKPKRARRASARRVEPQCARTRG